ncbi:MAG: hypothetical protein KJ970_05625, partial [Candidatus Eisenbacteria bacterium]|nr:hypothetical protein [Candidatus Eisenbacteria bacterium]
MMNPPHPPGGTAPTGGQAKNSYAIFFHFILLIVGLLLFIPPEALLAEDPGSTGLLIDVGRPDRMTLDGDLLEYAVYAPAIRWRGCDLKTVELVGTGEWGVRGKLIRVEMALIPGRYRIGVELWGLGENPTPIDLIINGLESEQRVSLKPDAPLWLEGEAHLTKSPLEILVKPDVGYRAILSRISVRTLDEPSPIEFNRLPPEKPQIPTGLMVAPGYTCQENIPLETLRLVCDQFVLYQLSNGLYQFGATKWWEAGFIVRALLAGHKLLEDERYLKAALRTMDLFVAEQEEDGGWCSTVNAEPKNDTGNPPCRSRNLADLGSITPCLSMAAPFLPDTERKRYLEAHRRYIENFVHRHLLPDGGYPNSLYAGIEHRSPYSIAVATTILSLTTFYLADGSPGALHQAEDAGRFLIDNWTEAGPCRFHPHDEDEPRVWPVLDFHNLYYIFEGLLCLYDVTEDVTLKEGIQKILGAYLYGSEGLFAKLAPQQWLPPTTEKGGTKSIGMLGLLMAMRRILGPEERLDRLLADGSYRLFNIETQKAFGVLLNPYTRRNWASLVPSSFAGLAAAEFLRPG